MILPPFGRRNVPVSDRLALPPTTNPPPPVYPTSGTVAVVSHSSGAAAVPRVLTASPGFEPFTLPASHEPTATQSPGGAVTETDLWRRRRMRRRGQEWPRRAGAT